MKKKQKQQPIQKPHVKRGDTVIVIAGNKDREQDTRHPNRKPKAGVIGKTGVVKRVFPEKGLVLVEGLNMIKKAVKPNPMLGQSGGIVEMEAPIAISNVMLYDLATSKPTRTRKELVQTADSKTRRVRVSKQTGEQIDA